MPSPPVMPQVAAYVRTLPSGYSDNFRSIVLSMLELDPSKRKSARDALTHPFFAGVTAASRSPLRVAKDAAFHEWKTKEVRASGGETSRGARARCLRRW